jgi:probable HAF family extracellular repeat protein
MIRNSGVSGNNRFNIGTLSILFDGSTLGANKADAMKTTYLSSLLATAFLMYAGHASAITVTELRTAGNLGGSMTAGLGLGNGNWTVVGEAELSNGERHAFVDSSNDGSSMVDLGTLGGTGSVASEYEMNTTYSGGYIVGSATLSNGDWRAFICEDDGTPSLVNLGTLGGSTSWGNSVNSSGQVAGYSATSTGDHHAFLYSGGSMTDLGVLGGSYSSAEGISASGVVVGYSSTSSGDIHAFSYSSGSMSDLGTLGGAYSFAYAIDDNGGIAGTSTLSTGEERAFRYTGGTMQNLGTLSGDYGSGALGINNSGEVVGYSYYGSASERAFIYSGGTMQDLNALASSYMSDGVTTTGFTRLAYAYDINDWGYIVGYGDYFDGTTITTQAFVLGYY